MPRRFKNGFQEGGTAKSQKKRAFGVLRDFYVRIRGLAESRR